MIGKKSKKSKKEKTGKNSKVEKEKKTRKPREKKKPEGSRYGALILLIVTVILSAGFYFYGVSSENGVELDFNLDMGKSVQTWEYSK